MATIAVQLKIDGERVVPGLEEARERLDSAESEMVIDFSSVRQIDTKALRAMEALAAVADAKGVTLMLRGTSIEVYKVLKLMKLAPRFSFAN
jgi:anti-anti-sigma regulatory factor